jgi:hypothetical protein
LVPPSRSTPRPHEPPPAASVRHDQAALDRAFTEEIVPWEEAWTRGHVTFATEPAGDVVEEARRLYAKYRPVADETYVSPPGLAVGKPVRASEGVEPGCVPALAVDGHYQTQTPHWAAVPVPQWIEVDLERPVTLTHVHVYPYWDNVRYYQYIVKASLDRKSWKTVVDARANLTPATRSGHRHTFAACRARYVRLTVTHNSANAAAHIVEFKVFGE